ncbi:FtsQ-type POTRA domain-containing protein [Desulfobulbus sp. US5]|nr:FtsQ-type POTRA domain-containing protein [Desulfobulbus sp. US5]
MARKKIRYRRQSAGRSPMLRQFRSNYIRPPAQLRIRVNMGRYQQSTSVTHKPEWNLQLIRKSLLLLVLVMLSVGAGRWGVQTLERSGVFSVRRVTVEGNRMSNEAQIRTLAEIKQGDQLFSVISEEVIERVRQHPWVDQVEVERVWPDTLTIRVHEYRPLAMINIEGKQQGLYYLDHHGIVFAPVESLQDIDYPVITGFAPPDGSGEVPGLDLAEGAMAEDVCDFLHVAARGNPILPLQSISEIHINREKGIIVYLVEHPFPIYVGYGNIEKNITSSLNCLSDFIGRKE